jgi:hypothetical protein
MTNLLRALSSQGCALLWTFLPSQSWVPLTEFTPEFLALSLGPYSIRERVRWCVGAFVPVCALRRKAVS